MASQHSHWQFKDLDHNLLNHLQLLFCSRNSASQGQHFIVHFYFYVMSNHTKLLLLLCWKITWFLVFCMFTQRNIIPAPVSGPIKRGHSIYNLPSSSNSPFFVPAVSRRGKILCINLIFFKYSVFQMAVTSSYTNTVYVYCLFIIFILCYLLLLSWIQNTGIMKSIIHNEY